MTASASSLLHEGGSGRLPTPWDGVSWALRPGTRGGGLSRARLAWRAAVGALLHRKTLRRWMAVVSELHARGVVSDREGEYLRALRPDVQRHTGLEARVAQLIDHGDWLETAFQPAALDRLISGQPVVLCELPAPRGFDFVGLQLRRSGPTSTEGQLLLTLTVRRSPDVQPKSVPLDVAVLAFSRLRIAGDACLAIGGVRGQRHPVLRVSPGEIKDLLQGWKPSVLLVRVAQELARFWGLRLLGLEPNAHRLQGWSYRWSKRHRAAAARIHDSYEALWTHFEAQPAPLGWVALPLHSDEKLAATALSPEKRSRQTRRADFWIRTRKVLHGEMASLLHRAGRDPRLERITVSLDANTVAADWDDAGPDRSDDVVPSRVLETGPGQLI